MEINRNGDKDWVLIVKELWGEDNIVILKEIIGTTNLERCDSNSMLNVSIENERVGAKFIEGMG